MTQLGKTPSADRLPDGIESQLHVALDNMPGALVYTDDALNIVLCNTRFMEMYPVPKELLARDGHTRISCVTLPSTAIMAMATSKPMFRVALRV